jgi:hypothetical protein
MVEGYVGRPGSGKSYSLVARALREYKLRGDQTELFSNIPLVGVRYTYVETFDQLLNIGTGIVLLDELGVWMSSRDSMKLPKPVRDMLAHHRKMGLNLYWSAQHENRVDAIIRELTNILWRCRFIPRIGVWQHGEDVSTPDMTFGSKFEKFRREVCATYETAWIIGDPKTGEGYRVGDLARSMPPVPLRGCERIVEPLEGSRYGGGEPVVRYVKTDPNRGIFVPLQ